MTRKPNRKSRSPKRASPSSRSWSWTTLLSRHPRLAGAGAALGTLGVLAAANRAAAKRAEAANPPAGAFVEVDDVRLHYVDRGKGPVVVLLHGNGVGWHDYEASGVLELAAAGHRVLAFDRPGFGHSARPRGTAWTPAAQAALIARALDRLAVGPAIVVGHSWGAMVALSLALDHPASVAGLVLLSGYYYGTARPDVLPVALPAIPILGDVLANTVSPLFGLATGPATIKASFAPAPVSDRFARNPVALMLRPSQARATAEDTAFMVPAAVAASRRYRELQLPVAIMAGEGDRIAWPDRHAERLATEIDGADLRLVPGQGHLFHYAVPEQVVASIEHVRQWAQAG